MHLDAIRVEAHYSALLAERSNMILDHLEWYLHVHLFVH